MASSIKCLAESLFSFACSVLAGGQVELPWHDKGI
jgi:hypothetical protein